jgi:hypothetical protein
MNDTPTPKTDRSTPITDDDFSDLVEACNSPAAKRIEQLERELAETREHYRMSSVCRKMKEQRDELSGHYHRLNAENVILQQQRDRLVEALETAEGFMRHDLNCHARIGNGAYKCHCGMEAAQFLAKQALAAVKGTQL